MPAWLLGSKTPPDLYASPATRRAQRCLSLPAFHRTSFDGCPLARLQTSSFPSPRSRHAKRAVGRRPHDVALDAQQRRHVYPPGRRARGGAAGGRSVLAIALPLGRQPLLQQRHQGILHVFMCSKIGCVILLQCVTCCRTWRGGRDAGAKGRERSGQACYFFRGASPGTVRLVLLKVGARCAVFFLNVCGLPSVVALKPAAAGDVSPQEKTSP